MYGVVTTIPVVIQTDGPLSDLMLDRMTDNVYDSFGVGEEEVNVDVKYTTLVSLVFVIFAAKLVFMQLSATDEEVTEFDQMT